MSELPYQNQSDLQQLRTLTARIVGNTGLSSAADPRQQLIEQLSQIQNTLRDNPIADSGDGQDKLEAVPDSELTKPENDEIALRCYVDNIALTKGFFNADTLRSDRRIRRLLSREELEQLDRRMAELRNSILVRVNQMGRNGKWVTAEGKSLPLSSSELMAFAAYGGRLDRIPPFVIERSTKYFERSQRHEPPLWQPPEPANVRSTPTVKPSPPPTTAPDRIAFSAPLLLNPRLNTSNLSADSRADIRTAVEGWFGSLSVDSADRDQMIQHVATTEQITPENAETLLAKIYGMHLIGKFEDGKGFVLDPSVRRRRRFLGRTATQTRSKPEARPLKQAENEYTPERITEVAAVILRTLATELTHWHQSLTPSEVVSLIGPLNNIDPITETDVKVICGKLPSFFDKGIKKLNSSKKEKSKSRSMEVTKVWLKSQAVKEAWRDDRYNLLEAIRSELTFEEYCQLR